MGGASVKRYFIGKVRLADYKAIAAREANEKLHGYLAA
jgi:hypothetical protein